MQAAEEGANESSFLVPDTSEGKVAENSESGSPSSDCCNRKWFRTCRRFLFYLIAPYFAGFLYGYSIGAVSGSVSSVNSAIAKELTTVQSSALTSASILGATIASILTFYVGETLGSRKELIIGSIFYLTGTALTELASAAWGRNSLFGFLFFCRCTYGIGIGFSMHGAPLYIAETSPSEIRGMLIAVKELLIITGMVTGYAVIALCDAVFRTDQDTWRISWSIPGPFAIAVIWIMYYAPSSPRWLVLMGRQEEATDALRELWPEKTGPEVISEAEEIQRSFELTKTDEPNTTRSPTPSTVDGDSTAEGVNSWISKYWINPCSAAEKRKWAKLATARGALVGGLGLVFFQQLTGQPTVLYYAQSIFIEAGFSEEDAKFSDLYVGLAKFCATLVSLPFVDRAGRKPLLLVGISIMLIALVLLAIGFSGSVEWQTQILFALILYVCGYQVGFGPITWVMISELFPLHSRARALGMSIFLNFALNLITTFLNGPLVDALGQCALFSFYTVMCALSIIFVWFLLPETKGKTLEEIDQMMTEGDLPALAWILGSWRDFKL